MGKTMNGRDCISMKPLSMLRNKGEKPKKRKCDTRAKKAKLKNGENETGKKRGGIRREEFTVIMKKMC